MRALSLEELAKQLESAHKELLDLRLKLTTKQLVNHRQIRWVKREIARLETIIREKELAIK
jgi:large subunit ribosomal protein L29